jgi:hypothetical protein
VYKILSEYEIEVVCIKSHGYFKDRWVEGRIYKCKYQKYEHSNDEYYKIYYINSNNFEDYGYAQKGNESCNLDYFREITKEITIPKKIRYQTFIDKIFKKYRYKIVNWKYDFTNTSDELFIFMFCKIIVPIQYIQKTEFYDCHQEKIHHILHSCIKINQASKYIDVKPQLERYKNIIESIEESIKIQEQNIKNENIRMTTQQYIEYFEDENKLLDTWEKGLKEIWN